jgi:glucose-6-phosphate isomerase
MLSLEVGKYRESVDQEIARLESIDFLKRLWQRDSAIFTGESGDESVSGFLGWLDAADRTREHLDELEAFAANVKGEDTFKRTVLAGMGGSSLAPLVLSKTLAEALSGPSLDVLDSTDPETVFKADQRAAPDDTLFLIASKSGTTAEPSAFDAYFWDCAQQKLGKRAGGHFAAITDPGSPLAEDARQRGFRQVFENWADIGGRFSALSLFGMVPAAILGVDLVEFLNRADRVLKDHGPEQSVAQAEGVRLGAALATLAKQGVDKMTLLLPERLSTFGLWLEQLIAESTGKHGVGVFPIACEPIGDPDSYGDDRVFVYIRPRSDTSLATQFNAIRQTGKPYLALEMADEMDLASQFVIWEIATAVMGATLGINPFDQPNVQESKDVTSALLKDLDAGGALPEENPAAQDDSFAIYGGQGGSVTETILDYLNSTPEGGYITLQTYVPTNTVNDEEMVALQGAVRDRTKRATSAGFGPRYLHSTGQYHKGGPDKARFIQITAAHRKELPIPGKQYGFGSFIDAQAYGDRKALEDKGRPVLRIHIMGDATEGLRRLQKIVREG